MDVTGIVGTGGGPRYFRIGGNLTFDFVPDIDNQPGVGLAAQAIYYRLTDQGELEATGVPYIHKSFRVEEGAELDPFFAFPIGLGFSSGNYKVVDTAVIGASFKNTEHFRYIFELGIDVNHTETYFSGGIVYYK